MFWEDVEKKYGKENADKMKKSQFLDGITVRIVDGKHDIPICDIENAYRDKVLKKPVHPLAWD